MPIEPDPAERGPGAASGPLVLRGRAGAVAGPGALPHAADDIAHTLELLRALQASRTPAPVLRAYAPLPTVAFSRRESLLPTFAAAQEAARRHGFEPVVRLAGGRAVAYDESCVVIDLLTPSLDRFETVRAFEVAASCIRDALRDLGIDARVGPVPGEYCPGDHSVNARGAVKLVGIAQRVVKGARLVTASIVLGGLEPLRTVVDEVYAAMELPWNPSTFGSVHAEGVAGVPAELADRLVAGLAGPHAQWAGDLS
jgi:octanoyl-[GcvH]:protein N-octanoyltransferase